MIWFLVSVKKLESRQIWGKTVNFLTPLSSLEGIFVCVFICLVSLGYASRFGFISEIFHLCIYFPDLVPIIVSKNVFQTLFSCNPTETVVWWDGSVGNTPPEQAWWPEFEENQGGKREPTSKMCALVCSLCTYVYTLAHTHNNNRSSNEQ